MKRRRHYQIEEHGLYRSRQGMIFGVCRGLAEHFDLSVFWIRMAFVVLTFLFWLPLGIYIVAALIMKPEPVIPFQTDDDAEFYNSYVNSRTMAIHRLKRTYDSLDRRIQRIENIVTARDFEWDSRLHE